MLMHGIVGLKIEQHLSGVHKPAACFSYSAQRCPPLIAQEVAISLTVICMPPLTASLPFMASTMQATGMEKCRRSRVCTPESSGVQPLQRAFRCGVSRCLGAGALTACKPHLTRMGTHCSSIAAGAE